MVVRDGRRAVRREPGRDGFVITEPGAGGDQIEDLHHLRAERPGEAGVAADRVLARDPALLVRRRAERQIRDAQQAVVGDDAVAGRPDMRQPGAHLLVDDHRTTGPGRRAGLGQQARVRPHADDDEHELGAPLEGPAVLQAGHGETTVRLAEVFDAGVGDDVHAVAGEFVVDEGAEFRVEGGEHFGAALQLGDLEAADGERFGHLQAHVAGADDDRGFRLMGVEVVLEGEGVAHRVQQVHTVFGAELVEAGDAGGRG